MYIKYISSDIIFGNFVQIKYVEIQKSKIQFVNVYLLLNVFDVSIKNNTSSVHKKKNSLSSTLLFNKNQKVLSVKQHIFLDILEAFCR